MQLFCMNTNTPSISRSPRHFTCCLPRSVEDTNSRGLQMKAKDKGAKGKRWESLKPTWQYRMLAWAEQPGHIGHPMPAQTWLFMRSKWGWCAAGSCGLLVAWAAQHLEMGRSLVAWRKMRVWLRQKARNRNCKPLSPGTFFLGHKDALVPLPACFECSVGP